MLFSIVAAFFVATALAHEGHDHPIQDSDKIKLTIYYESLCSDSISFFKNQLTPTYKSLNKYLSLDFVPFGKATQTIINGSFSISCHHGEVECYGNIVQACATKNLHDEDIYRVINCLMTDVNPDSVKNDTYPTVECLQKYNLQKTKLDSCIHTQQGLLYLSEMGNKTAELNPKLTSVPSVAVDKKFDYAMSKSAVDNLTSFVCKKLKDSNKNVKECNGSGVVTSSFLLLAVSSFLRSFISS